MLIQMQTALTLYRWSSVFGTEFCALVPLEVGMLLEEDIVVVYVPFNASISSLYFWTASKATIFAAKAS